MRVATLEEIPETNIKNDILRLVTLVQVQLKKVIDAYVSKDIGKAREVIQNDIEIDNNYNVIYEKIVDLIKGKVSKLRLLTYTKLLFAIKTLERAGDHIGNVAEEIHFIVTGEHIDLKDNKEGNLEEALEDSNK
jgi:phosphate transport system protein